MEVTMTRRSVPIMMALSALALAGMSCSLVGRVVGRAVDDATGGAMSTIESLQGEMATAMATLPAEFPSLPGGLPLSTEAAPANAGEATISGSLSYPSEAIPALKIVVFDAATMELVVGLETAAGQSTYSASVPYGGYYVVAYTLDGR